MGRSMDLCAKSRKEFIKSRLQGWDNEQSTATLIDHSDKGSHLWKLIECTAKQGPAAGQVTRFISLDLIKKRGGEGWHYTSQDESEGLSHYDCPLRFLDQAPTPGGAQGAASQWRWKVRGYHADKAKRAKSVNSLKPGQLVEIQLCHKHRKVLITSVDPLQGVVDGIAYNIRPSDLAGLLSNKF